MAKFIKIILILAVIFNFLGAPAFARHHVLTDVKVIHASTGPQQGDPGLNKIIHELKSVFKYTSYKLLKEQRLNLDFTEKGRVNLPGKRTLIVIPTNMEGKRIRYQIHIKKNKRIIFQTRVLLKNNSSITIGGPQFNNGFLLFNISGLIP
jgi:hypothetical protein